MKVTIRDVSEKAGVSIATVSHVINKTRYVSPDLINKVMEAIDECGYSLKLSVKDTKLCGGRNSTIALVLKNINNVYDKIIEELSYNLSLEGFLLSVYLTNNNEIQEKVILRQVKSDKNIAGIIIANSNDEIKRYKEFNHIPIVCLENESDNKNAINVLSDIMQGIYSATKYLIRSSHKSIGVLIDESEIKNYQWLEGYKKALAEKGIEFDENFILRINGKSDFEEQMKKKYAFKDITAIITMGDNMTLNFLRFIKSNDLSCPGDISLIGFNCSEWVELLSPELTVMNDNIEKITKIVSDKIISKIRGEQGYNELRNTIKVGMDFIVRKSTQIIGYGLFEEKVFNFEDIHISEEEAEYLRNKEFKVAISFHYGGTTWARLHEKGIRDTLDKFGIKVIAVTDAHFDAFLQVTQLEGLSMQKPDAIISIPADDKITAEKFKNLSKETKLIFISNIPAGFTKNDYVSCVSVDERENGTNAGRIIGEYYQDCECVNIAMLQHGATFYGTYLRDMIAEQVIRENYTNINIANVEYFYQIEKAYEKTKEIVSKNPEITGLYISWERPALEAIRALKEIGRSDISIFTYDLDTEIASYLGEDNFVKGLSTQRPLDQGIAVALATAKALLGEYKYKYIGVKPVRINSQNLLEMWENITNEEAPKELKNKKIT